MSKHHAGGRASSAMTALVLDTYGLTCHLCQRPGATTRDHLVPLARGGLDILDNCRPAHHRCNSRRQDRPLTPALLAEFRARVEAISVDPAAFFEDHDRQEAPRPPSIFSRNVSKKTLPTQESREGEA
ncbi:MAG: HNH endonuclease signature motif containing protein [Aeromicrobium sp.]|uniref:HNH endonuclease n=1 Tax=Aeromicrobium sp. TaxID=1871063 RepID=UPI0039E31483